LTAAQFSNEKRNSKVDAKKIILLADMYCKSARNDGAGQPFKRRYISNICLKNNNICIRSMFLEIDNTLLNHVAPDLRLHVSKNKILLVLASSASE